jgi:hypothetical protein
MGSCVQLLFSSNFARFRGHCRYNAKPSDRAGAGIFVPRPHQIEASEAILATSFHTNLVDLIEGCSRDNKVPQTL